MRFRGAILALLALASGCRGRSVPAASGPPAAETVETVVPAPFVPEFSVQAIPPEVEARMLGRSYPAQAAIPLSELRYLRLSYYDFEGEQQTGELVCNAAIAEDLRDIFSVLYEARYPICSIRLVDDFDGSDDASMAADNTSCFNYRTVPGQKKLSNHARGLAIDINPLENPYIDRSGRVRPPEGEAYADRSGDFPHKIDRTDLCYRLFREHGFNWGGAWRSMKDYQHFEKPL
ncbi:MAG: M15 family metallopeptidase [Bacteroidales bacterium]|nr:M15 family metallopeptidase [Bacteroidales bacterium]